MSSKINILVNRNSNCNKKGDKKSTSCAKMFYKNPTLKGTCAL